MYTQTVTNQNYKFTGQERDGESQLDNFGARFDASSLGRFMTPDWSASPAAVPYAQLSNPQSLNLYAYALNSPITRADLDGHFSDEIAAAMAESDASFETFVNGYYQNPGSNSPTSPRKRTKGKKAQKHLHKPKPKPLVKGDAGRTIHPTKMAAERWVYYYNVDKNGTATHEKHVLTLSETIVGTPPQHKVSICSPPCVEEREEFVNNGETKDHQQVIGNDSYSVQKRFSVDGQPAKILNEQNVPFDFEILHNSNQADSPFQSEYGNDPPH